MNYIGSKATLLPFIHRTITELAGGQVVSLADLFAGTGAVGAFFKSRGARIIANDIQYYSYALNRHLIGNSAPMLFEGLVQLHPDRNLAGEELAAALLDRLEGREGFIYNNYALGGTRNSAQPRMYFSDNNARKCDAIRQQIEAWRAEGVITENEYFYLLASLIETVDKYANTASVYGAFLKKLKKTAEKTFVFELTPVVASEQNHQVFCNDANQLIRQIEGQVLYLDPPYNQRQYCTNYHLLETLARYDDPFIYGKTGLREYAEQKSRYCSSREAVAVFEDLVQNARFEYIVLSYNNEGIIPLPEIERIMSRRGRYTVCSTRHVRYKADRNRTYSDDSTTEYLHCLQVR